MYIYIMRRRTQIYLSEREQEALARVARASGHSKSELIRQAVARVYLDGADPERALRALRASAGAWRRRAGGAAYVERRRPGLGARLRRAGA
jgi:hypothetical protein